MNARRTSVLLGIVSAIGVLLLAIADVGRKSPGPVSRVHARIDELDGGAACSMCHGGWFGDLRSSCADCHEDIATQVQARRGLHGTFVPELAAACGTCHGEHHGDEFRLVNRLAFAQAGIPDVLQFDHRRIGFALGGAHTALACTKCHTNADAALLPGGGKRYLGLQQACGSCHQDPHGGAMQVACTTCHSQDSFGERDVPEHDRWLLLDGAHAGVDCRQCHAAATPGALERIVAGSAATAARTCGDCHTAPHSAAFVAGNATALQAEAKASCVACHPLDYPKFADPRASVDAAQHAHGGFPLQAPHDRVACVQCHAPGTTFAERHPGRRPDQCVACHQDPHAGQFAEGVFAARGCVECHAATHFAPHGFDLQHHARTRLPLDGRHAEAACAACHADPAPGEPRRFAATPHRCEQCHADVHQPVFAPLANELAAEPRGTCAACHGTRAFAAVDHTTFAHAERTGFAVTGAHAQIECTDCHRRTESPDAQGRRFGRVDRHGEQFAGCVTCHQDPHGGAFDRSEQPAVLDGRVGCERCHDTASFRTLPFGFDHAAATGYALTGAHAALDCTACHARRTTPDASGRTWDPAHGRECADCHRDPHQGQFERLGRTDCSRCHRSTVGFAALAFRHNLDSRFPLSDAHAKVPCANCHKQERIRGQLVARYLPLPTECAQCHGTDGAPSRRRKG